MKRKLLATAAITTIMLAAGCSKEQPDKPIGANSGAAASSASPAAVANDEKLLQDAVLALQETENAVAALDKKDAEAAKAALERATGKLEIVLAQNPKLALAPVDVSIVTHDVLASVEAVDALRKSAEEALEDGRVQEARHLIDGLASETVVRVSNLPLATYPAAIKSAAALLAQNKVAEAKQVLTTALATIVIRDVIHPLPLSRARAAIEQARKLAAAPSRSSGDDAKIQQFLTTAREQLKLGQALGYATKDDMRGLLKTVDEIEEGVKDKNSGASIFDRIRGLFDRATTASQPKEKG